jgi:hypothetical protein
MFSATVASRSQTYGLAGGDSEVEGVEHWVLRC